MKKIIYIMISLLISMILFGCVSGPSEAREITPTSSIEQLQESESSPQKSSFSKDYVYIPIKDLSTKAMFYSLDYQRKRINYIAVKGADGKIRTAFDACDVCGGSKGYKQKGNDLVCNKCERSFLIDSLGTKNLTGGGCWPSYLEHQIQGEYIKIKKTDIEAHAYQF